MAYYGIDLHSDTITVAKIKNEKKQHKIITFSCQLWSMKYQKFLDDLNTKDVILIEATTQSFWFYDQVRNRVRNCYILNTHKLPVHGNKTDKLDAIKLVKILMYNELMISDPEELPYIYVPNNEVRELRGLFTSYKLLNKSSTQAKNRIHSIYKQNGVKITKSSLGRKKYRNELISKHPLKKMWIIQMVSLLNILEAIEIEKKQLKEIIVYKGYKQFPKEVTKLISIKGFSPFTSVALMADICTIERFRNSKKFCSYLRTAPKVIASNNTVHLGKINKRGRTLTCSLLTQSVIHIGNANQHFINFKERLQKGKKACTVRMAIIRKILTSAYYMLKNNVVFRGADKESYKRKLLELNRIIKKYDKIEGKAVA